MTLITIETIALDDNNTVKNLPRIVDKDSFFHACSGIVETGNGDIRVVFVRFAKGGDLVEFMMNEQDFTGAFNMNPPGWGRN